MSAAIAVPSPQPNAAPVILVCRVCSKDSIPAPAEATATTKFTCRRCCAAAWRTKRIALLKILGAEIDSDDVAKTLELESD